MTSHKNKAYVYDDGGRKAAGFKGHTGDCACRAIAIATGLPYRTVYDDLFVVCQNRRFKRGRSHPRTGVHKKVIREFMAKLGWRWTPIMGIGTGCKVHLRPDELPPGRLVLSLSKHYAAVIDGVLHDTYDCARDGTRCVYGYYTNA